MPQEEDWIGRVDWPDGTHAVLGGDGKWRCADPQMEEILNFKFNPSGLYADGCWMPYGTVQVSQAAADLGGKSTFAKPIEPLKEGEVS
jgi:hypothetical protein